MAIKFDFYTIPNPKDYTKKITHIRTVMDPSLPMDQNIEQMAKGRTITKSDIKAVLSALGSCIKSELLANRCFYLEEVGTFSLSAQVSGQREGVIEKTRSGQIDLDKIIFRPDKQLLKELKNEAIFKKTNEKRHSPNLSEERVARILMEYFKEHSELTRKNFEQLTGYTRTTALRRLKMLEQKGVLYNAGSRQEGRYKWKEPASKIRQGV
ncbi:MAG: hypothetical protein ACRC3Z_06500 [Phocaeicola sp.]